ncbi:MAG: sodium:proton antiporter [Lachnospiraceae bacterium]
MKKNKITYHVGVITLFIIIGLVLYIYTSTTGYLASSSMNIMPVALTIVSIILLFSIVFIKSNISEIVEDLFLLISTICLLISSYIFIISRVALAADVYFIPVNYPASEKIALHTSIVGASFYMLGIIAIIITSFVVKREEQ